MAFPAPTLFAGSSRAWIPMPCRAVFSSGPRGFTSRPAIILLASRNFPYSPGNLMAGGGGDQNGLKRL